jgi:hypothetical protein
MLSSTFRSNEHGSEILFVVVVGRVRNISVYTILLKNGMFNVFANEKML